MATNILQKIQFDKESFNLDSFIKATARYLNSYDNIPLLVAESSPKFEHDKMRIEIYFFDKLLKTICEKKEKYSRDLRDLVIYGYIGQSRGGKNGLVLIPERDRNLSGIVEKFDSNRYSDFCKRIGIFGESKSLSPVKVVTHRKNGERMVGVFNRTTKEAVLYETRSYSK